jgi:tetratricopeptide (TPR) repeat protein
MLREMLKVDNEWTKELLTSNLAEHSIINKEAYSYFKKGNILLGLNQMDDGLIAYEEALKCDPEYGVKIAKYTHPLVTDNEGNTLVHLAIAHKKIEVVQAILNNNLESFDYKNSQNGQTLLHTAARFNQPLLIELLLTVKPALLNFKDNDNYTALNWASRCSSQDALNKLLKYATPCFIADTLVKAFELQDSTLFDFIVEQANIELLRNSANLIQDVHCCAAVTFAIEQKIILIENDQMAQLSLTRDIPNEIIPSLNESIPGEFIADALGLTQNLDTTQG